ncbi:MAG: MucB/RseB C-terminal domain-containing protein [Gammaproteobacteria bacterium]|nr:MucB/RseB C-terminal domain-containing protein [Gammaproteobacteria bacterium]
MRFTISLQRLWPILLLLPWCFASAAHAANCEGADPEALAWLDKMGAGIHQHSYHGVVTLQRRENMHVMQVSHLVNQGVSSERMTQLTGQGARVDRSAHPLECVHPGHRLLQVGKDLQAGNCGIASQYRFVVNGKERVAGRAAVRLQIVPRDMYRYGYRIALDRETGLLLKAETYGHGDKVLEKFQYANLSYEDAPRGSAEVETVHQAEHPHPDHSAITAPVSKPWAVNWLPRGFAATDASAGVSGRRSYTDGLAVFSVFLEEFEHEIRPGEGVVREGATTAYTRGMSVEGEPVLITVIGEVPVNTARMVADSIDWMP